MKNILHILTIFLTIGLLITTGCKQTEKALHNGDYDTVINKTLKKLRTNKTKDKHVLLLEEAYAKANARDLREIQYLQEQRQDSNWERIYSLYTRLEYRQRKVEALIPLYTLGRVANLEIRDYTKELAESKNQAAEYTYAKAMNLLYTKDKFDARKAYELFADLQRLYPSYKDASQRSVEARLLGTNYVLVRLRNGSSVSLPPQFDTQLRRMNLAPLNETWTIYHTSETATVKYDYDVVVNVLGIEFSPERINEKHYIREKEVQDGWTYVQEECGAYVTDSLGNKIKTPIYKVVVGEVLETEQSKVATIKANVDYFRRTDQKLLNSYPIAGTTTFYNKFVELSGNLLAIEKSLVTCAQQSRPLPFPNNQELLLASYGELQNSLKGALRKGRSVIP